MKIRYHVCTSLCNVFIKQPVDLKITMIDIMAGAAVCMATSSLNVLCQVFHYTRTFF